MAEWFAPKKYGYGGGLPISWQGWVVTLVYAAVVLGAAYFLAEISVLAFGSILVTATAIMLAIVARTTRGGWRWRWGGDE